MTRLISALGLGLLTLSQAYAQQPPTPGETASSLAAARARIARYRLTPPETPEERCFDLKLIARALRDGGDTAAFSSWQNELRQTCERANKPADL